MKKIIILFIMILSTVSYSQTAITDANFQTAINTCLSSNPEDGLCTNSEYGSMPDWDVSNVTSMKDAFQSREDFNGDISAWDVSNVTNMNEMFFLAESFNQNIGSWDVSNVEDMAAMFANTLSFNQPLNDWDVSNVVEMYSMFFNSNAFNQPIGDWDVSSVTNMSFMFQNVTSFNQDLSSWDVSNVSGMTNMFNDSGLSRPNYDGILNSWSQQDVQTDVIFGAEGITYCNGADARQSLIVNYGWNITDAGNLCTPASVDDQNQLDISVYPNPTSDIVYIDGNYSQLKVVVYDILGKQVINKSITNSIDISQLEKGVYILQLSDGAKVTTQRIIKN